MPYAEHPSFIAPAGNPTIWRYIDFAKYASMLVVGGLFFSRADGLGDPFEGSLPLVTSLQMDGLAATAGDPVTLRRTIAQHHEAFRRWSAVCCWHMNDVESWAMWKSYGSAGIAIVSTFDLFVASLRESPTNVFIGEINYLDFDDDRALHALGGNSFDVLMCKRDVFASEAELRAVITRLPEGGALDPAINTIDDGILIPLDLNELIVEVRVSPAAEQWRLAMIQDVTERYGVRAPVRQSAMDRAPRW